MTTVTEQSGSRHHRSVPGGAIPRMLGNETAKSLRIVWAHKPALVPQLAMLAVTYLLFQLVLGGGRLVAELLPVTLLAFSVYIISYITLLKMVAGLLEEVNTGTLEQAHLSPLRPWQLSIGRLTAVMIEGILTALLVGGAFVLALGIDVPWRASALLPLALTLVDIAGFALMLGAAALVVSSIGAVVHVTNSAVMMINGSVVPIAAFPAGLEIVAQFAPTTLGIDATRQALIEGQSLGVLLRDGSLALAALHAAVMVLIGWFAYHAAIRKGLREGRLGP